MQLAIVRQCVEENQYKSQKNIGNIILPFRWVGRYWSLYNVLVTWFNTDGLLRILNHPAWNVAAVY
jgi:hypothetical protein